MHERHGLSCRQSSGVSAAGMNTLHLYVSMGITELEYRSEDMGILDAIDLERINTTKMDRFR